MGNERFLIGHRIRWGGGHEGVVVGVIERNEYLLAADARRWSPLGYGVLIKSTTGEITHVRDASVVLIPIA